MESAFGILEKKSKELNMPKFFRDINLARDERTLEKEAMETQTQGLFLWACGKSGTRLCILNPYRRDERYFNTEMKEWRRYAGQDKKILRMYVLSGEVLKEVSLNTALSLIEDCIREIKRCEKEWQGKDF